MFQRVASEAKRSASKLEAPLAARINTFSGGHTAFAALHFESSFQTTNCKTHTHIYTHVYTPAAHTHAPSRAGSNIIYLGLGGGRRLSEMLHPTRAEIGTSSETERSGAGLPETKSSGIRFAQQIDRSGSVLNEGSGGPNEPTDRRLGSLPAPTTHPLHAVRFAPAHRSDPSHSQSAQQKTAGPRFILPLLS